MPLVATPYALLLLVPFFAYAIALFGFNLLFGMTGLLSFGHAVYFGIGAFVTAHAINWVDAGRLWFPITFMPLFGGLAGLGDVGDRDH